MNSLVAVGSPAPHSLLTRRDDLAGWFTRAGVMPDVYYDAVVIIIALVLAGRTLEARARRQTAAALRSLPACSRRRRRSSAMDRSDGAARAVGVGDIVLVRPGEHVAVDGVIIAGTGTLDESMLTGESMPVTRTVGGSGHRWNDQPRGSG
jgi:Cu+-exporting ATPase